MDKQKKTVGETTQSNSYVVTYPIGTSEQFKVFEKLEDAKKFLDDQSNRTYMVLPKSTLSIFEFDIPPEGMMEINIDEVYDMEAVRREDVDTWQIEDVWAEKNKDGKLILLEPRFDNKKPDPEEGWEVIEAYSDGIEIYESLEEAEEVNEPSQYLTQF